MITDTSCESQHATRRTLHHSLRLAGTFDGGVFVSEQLRDDVWRDETTTAGRLQRCSPVRILPIQVNMIPDSSSRYRATMLIQIERMSRLDGTPTGGDNTTSERRREGNASYKHAQTKAGHLGKGFAPGHLYQLVPHRLFLDAQVAHVFKLRESSRTDITVNPCHYIIVAIIST